MVHLSKVWNVFKEFEDNIYSEPLNSSSTILKRSHDSFYSKKMLGSQYIQVP